MSSATQKSDAAANARAAYALAPMPAQPFGKYTLIGKLGHGGMAEVNLAVVDGKAGFRKLTVIKRLHRHLAVEPGFIEMFLDEARLAARLNHPHCVQTYEVGEHDGNHYLAMEYLDGQGFERLLRMSGQLEIALEPEIAARIVADALDGLSYAHELTDFDGTPLTVVHRDVSPQNIFVTYNGMVKLLDFGIAKAATHVVETRTGVIKGKYAYIAPEQAVGQAEVDQRSDLWSMGVVLWESLTGRRLFKSVNELATLHETLQGEIKLPSAYRRDLSTELDTICMRALQRKPNERYQSAQEMKEDLERYLYGLPHTPTRKDVARVMRDRFSEVLSTHKKTLAACLEGSGAQVSESTIERLVAPGAGNSETPTPSGVVANASVSAQIPETTPSQLTPSVTPPPLVASAPPPPEEDRRGGGGLWWKALVALAVILLAVVLGLMLPIGEEPDGDGDTVAENTTAQNTGQLETPEAVPTPEAIPTPEPAQPDPPPQLGDPLVMEPAQPETPDDAPSVEAAPEPSPTPRPRLSRAERARLAAQRRERERRDREREPAPQAPTTQPTSQPATGSGFLTLATTPWTEVSLGGRALGTTPLLRVELPAGTHRLRLVNREQGIDESYRVNIRAGETLTRRVGLR